MAEKKVAVATETIGGRLIELWCDASKEEIEKIEGVARAGPYAGQQNHYLLDLDPRYDIYEIESEIHKRFAAGVPDAFLEL